MPFETHPSLITPLDDTIIWRYMDFARFIQLLETQTLWFARADQFEDLLEGTYTDAELADLRSLVDPPGHPGRSIADIHVSGTRLARATTYVNCWRTGAAESLAMWDLYGKGSGIVAIKSSIRLLKDALNKQPISVNIAQVRYIDWTTAPWDNNSLVMCARKDSSYEHEAEVRAIIWEVASSNHAPLANITDGMKRWNDRTANDPPFGITVPIDISKTIKEVIVGPREHAWVAELVGRIINRYGLSIPVIPSDRLRPRL